MFSAANLGSPWDLALMGGPTDIAIIAVVVLVLFGASKLGTMGKSLGEGIREFKKATREEDVPASPPVQAQVEKSDAAVGDKPSGTA